MIKRNTSPPRGMRDLLPAQVRLRTRCEALIRESYSRHGFDAIETPALEQLELLTSGQGGDNEKLIYKVLKRGEKLDEALPLVANGVDGLADLGLRYDLTVPLARFYAQNQGQLPAPFKAFQIGPVWRAERPQKGRFRQFTQCDIDILGEAGSCAEVELVEATTATLAALGLRDFVVRLNDRRLLSAMVSEAGFNPAREASVLVALDKLDKLGPQGVRDELLAEDHPAASVDWLLAILVRGEQGLADVAGGGGPALAALEGLESIRGAFSQGLPAGGRLVLDPSLVRGMGYYTGPIFEVGLEGYGFSVAGGGRYDEMVSGLLGRSVPACGFSIGFERVVLVLEDRGAELQGTASRVALLYDPDQDELGTVLQTGRALRASGWAVVAPVRARKHLGKQLDELGRHGFTHFVHARGGESQEPRDLHAR